MKMANNLIEQCQGFKPSTLCNFPFCLFRENSKKVWPLRLCTFIFRFCLKPAPRVLRLVSLLAHWPFPQTGESSSYTVSGERKVGRKWTETGRDGQELPLGRRNSQIDWQSWGMKHLLELSSGLHFDWVEWKFGAS